MSEVVVHFAPNRMDAEVAAAALRAEHLHPRIAPDPASGILAAGGTASAGRWLVYVPEHEEAQSREILHEPATDERVDNPILRMVTIVVLISALLLAAPFVAQACYGSR
ncbi:MAG: hypothetical protein E6H89_11515 [Chloroflexi bacterium]|nr:MAG: hypothetical protein E6I83_00935 [Chloroflexota bacterium]TME69203.1 MAG: hypothetical protein E6I49_11965 [Chloroflexota bacterium]TMG50107.1 MAG: hypothetical protein E6H89_11515 [Chloroflexota bacterium]